MPQNSEEKRRASWWVGSASIVLPGLFLSYWIADYLAWSKHPTGEMGFFVYLLMGGFALAGSALLSAVAAWLNWQHLRRNRPVTPQRNAEFALIALPALLGGLALLATVLPTVLLSLVRV